MTRSTQGQVNMFSTRIYQVFLVEIVLSMYRLNATCGTGNSIHKCFSF